LRVKWPLLEELQGGANLSAQIERKGLSTMAAGKMRSGKKEKDF